MRINEGHFDQARLDGLVWAVVFRWPGPLHLGNGTIQPYIDQKADDAQRGALLTILSGKAGGPWFEVVASLVSKVHPPKFVPIQFEFDMTGLRGRCAVPGEVEVSGKPIKNLATGADVRIRVEMPEGIEYLLHDVGTTDAMRSTGAIQFDLSGTHSGLSQVEHTPTGLKR